MQARVAHCSCGQLSVTCRGEPVRISACHCLDCQRRTGSVYGVQAWFASDRVSIDGEATRFERMGDSGARLSFFFCPKCGSTVYWRIEGVEEITAVAVGAFADPAFPRATVSVYDNRRHAWAFPASFERHE